MSLFRSDGLRDFPCLPDERFAVIYADPPWDYKGQLQHAGVGSGDTGGAQRHYPTVTLQNLKQLPISRIAAENSILFLWATSPHLDQAIDLGKAWGFAWATVAFVWDKQRTNPGYYTLSQCELCLAFKRGKIPQPRGARNVRQLVSEKRKSHSAKPDEVRTRIESMFPHHNKIELFARGGGIRMDSLGAGIPWPVNTLNPGPSGRVKASPADMAPKTPSVSLWTCTLRIPASVRDTNPKTCRVSMENAQVKMAALALMAYILSLRLAIQRMAKSYTLRLSVNARRGMRMNVLASI